MSQNDKPFKRLVSKGWRNRQERKERESTRRAAMKYETRAMLSEVLGEVQALRAQVADLTQLIKDDSEPPAMPPHILSRPGPLEVVNGVPIGPTRCCCGLPPSTPHACKDKIR